MNTNDMNMDEVFRLADAAAQKSDRWLFIVLLIVLLLAVFLIVRWVMQDREKMAVRLTSMTDRHIEQSQRLGEVVTNNTAALIANRETLDEVKRTIAACEVNRMIQERDRDRQNRA